MPNEVNIFVQRFGAVLRGPSAYELAVAGGYQGSLEQWLTDRQGLNGTNGWAPLLALVVDGQRCVLRVADWTGGSGTKPAVGQYIGPAGLTNVLAEAIDLRGPAGTAGATGGTGNTGAAGASAWTPVLAVVTDGARRVLQVADWTGGSGTKPTTGQYVGATGLTAVLAEAIDVRGAAGATGATGGPGNPGAAGANAWTPILAVVADDSRRVMQVVDWTGGSGTKPTTGQYVGASGLTAVLADAIDIRGAAGATGATGGPGNPGAAGASAWTPVLAVVTDGARRVLQVADWTGGSGTKPTTGQYVGATGLTAVLAEAIDVRGAAGATGATGGVGNTGAAGASAWTPILAVVTDGARRVLQVADWTGGSGTKPTTGQYIGATGLTAVLAEAIDVRGAAGATGATGGPGNPGAAGASAWTPILAVVSDGARRVLQVADWTGGSGTKPTTGQYVGATGLTAVLANAVDIRALTNTDGLAEGTTNLWFTVARALAAVEGSNAAVGDKTVSEMLALNPAAPENVGRMVRLTDLGDGSNFFIASGGFWRPMQGRASLLQISGDADVSIPVGGSTTFYDVPGSAVSFPGVLLCLNGRLKVYSELQFPDDATGTTDALQLVISDGTTDFVVIQYNSSSSLESFSAEWSWGNRNSQSSQEPGNNGTAGSGFGNSTVNFPLAGTYLQTSINTASATLTARLRVRGPESTIVRRRRVSIVLEA